MSDVDDALAPSHLGSDEIETIFPRSLRPEIGTALTSLCKQVLFSDMCVSVCRSQPTVCKLPFGALIRIFAISFRFSKTSHQADLLNSCLAESSFMQGWSQAVIMTVEKVDP